MKIDSHQHFWKFDKEDYGWMDEKMLSIQRDFLPSDLSIELAALGFDGSVAVQARQSEEETNWLLQLAQQNDCIKGVVGWVDLRNENAALKIADLASQPKAVGVRHVIHDEQELDFMIQPAFIKGVKLLEAYRLTYDLLIFPKHLPNTIRLVEQCSRSQIFVVDHIAKPPIESGIIQPWKDGIVELAKFPNVYCKLSGMVTEANWKLWKPTDIRPYLDAVFEAFGVQRVLIGSDWPVCLVAGKYGEVMGVVLDYISSFTQNEKNLIMGGNALAAYPLLQL